MPVRASVAAALTFAAALVLVGAHLSPTLAGPISLAAPRDGICHGPETLKEDLFSGHPTAIYDFAGEDASELQDAIAAAVDDALMARVAAIRTVLVLDGPWVAFFLYGPDGCFYRSVESSLEWAIAVFQETGLTSPFGLTFYKLPDVPA